MKKIILSLMILCSLSLQADNSYYDYITIDEGEKDLFVSTNGFNDTAKLKNFKDYENYYDYCYIHKCMKIYIYD